MLQRTIVVSDCLNKQQTKGQAVCVIVQEILAEHADASRIFEHMEHLDTPADTLEWSEKALEAEDTAAWYTGQE